MTYLLDTNVISELRKSEQAADPRVHAWARRQQTQSLFLSAITILEIEIGVSRVERRDPDQGLRLRGWLEERVLAAFAGRILSVDVTVARRAATMHVPDPCPERDALIAATAAVNGLQVATRNTADFARTGVVTVDPWAPAPR